MACDICNKKGTFLTDLQTYYQTDDIKQVCSECESELNKHLSKLRSLNLKLNETWMKRFAKNLKTKLFNKG